MNSQHPIIINVGKAIRTRREAAGISQEEMAAEIFLDRAYYSHIERGRYNITLIVLFRIAAGLKCNPGDLLPQLADIKDLPEPSKARGRKRVNQDSASS